MDEKEYMTIVHQNEAYLSQYGDSFKGTGRFKVEQALNSYQTMLELIRPKPDGDVTLLDFGCGLSQFYQYMLEAKVTGVKYSGLDISEKFLDVCRSKYPGVPYYSMDVLVDDSGLPHFDYIVMNGIFTQKCDLSYDAMWDYFTRLTTKVYAHADTALAFNVHSKIVDWERDDLFHVPFDPMAKFVAANLSRHFTIRHDYRLYEYTVYVYR